MQDFEVKCRKKYFIHIWSSIYK